MISTLHLLWIVPVSVIVGMFVMALAVAAGDKRE